MLTSCDLYDRYLEQLQVCTSPLVSFGGVKYCQGQLVTVSCYQDNSQVKQRLTQSDGTGKVLVVDGGGCISHALLGDVIAEAALANNWQGIIINGAIRDVGALSQLNIHIKALATVPRKTDRKGQGMIDTTFHFGSVDFIPGHWLCSDDEGLVTSEAPITLRGE